MTGRLARRVAAVEQATGGGRVFVSFVDQTLSEAEKRAQERAEVERLGIRPADLHVLVLRRLGAPEGTP